uniref:K-box domain-containing protein n=1 Tax=Lactuca sativa TaxID=4236 RepID=A0A9R1VZQ9_LACSA|nr:hypothetical protein LSAT_V11C400162970 [Lactuca sativa]
MVSRYHKSRPQAEERPTQDTAIDEEGKDVSVNDMTELEKELNAALMHTRSRKTQLMMERVSSLREQLQVASAVNQYCSRPPQKLRALPLFKD